MKLIINIQLSIYILLLFLSCKKGELDLSNYSSLITCIKKNFKPEIVQRESSSIKKVDYFPSSPGKYLIITFKVKGSPLRIYKNVSRNFWNKFISAQSMGKFYSINIRNKKEFYLNLNSKKVVN